jgi:transcriptional regulator
MYIPKHFEAKDLSLIIKFMKEYNFASLVNYTKNKFWATHLPFLINEYNGKIILKSHMAKANPQWVNFKDDENVLVIFQQPHSYISPKNYNSPVNVPTWNYIAIHAYGLPKLLNSDEEKIKLLEDSFAEFEPDFIFQWQKLPDDYKSELLSGIIAFEIEVTDLHSKFKLSQNKTKSDIANIIEKLSNSSDENQFALSKYMKNIYKI